MSNPAEIADPPESHTPPVDTPPEIASETTPLPEQGSPENSVLPGSEETDESGLGLSRTDRRFLLVSCTIILVLVVLNLVQLNRTGAPRVLLESPTPFQVDINQAGWVEWMQLPDIGEVTARNIVADRNQNGPFQSIDDVQRVKGIGPATMKKIRPLLKELPKDSVNRE
ncbi:MAG TPA: helix-hairpin-helix domain-containing protein [Planctomicrobium sp.]|nr:helix-hairpin-helix domain-containing protein [Planctomicrobium sp.]